MTTAKQGSSGLKIFVLVFFAVLLAIIVAGFVLKWYFFPAQFKPVNLSAKEESVLQQKLKVLGYQVESDRPEQAALEPEAYSEAGASNL